MTNDAGRAAQGDTIKSFEETIQPKDKLNISPELKIARQRPVQYDKYTC